MVDVDPQEIVRIADTTRTAGRRIRNGEALKDAPISIGTFGGLDETVGIVAAHTSASDVVRATLKGVEMDIEHFANNLDLAVEDLNMADTVVTAGMTLQNLYGAPTPAPAQGITSLDDVTLNNMANIETTDNAGQQNQSAIDAATNPSTTGGEA